MLYSLMHTEGKNPILQKLLKWNTSRITHMMAVVFLEKTIQGSFKQMNVGKTGHLRANLKHEMLQWKSSVCIR